MNNIQRIDEICQILESTYGSNRFGNPENPLDDLIYIIISNKSTIKNTSAAYLKLKEKFPTWNEITHQNISDIEEILKPTGIHSKKSNYITGSISKIKKDFGSADLDKLITMDERDIEEYLVSLPGVSLKVARCVMMYTMNARVLPVDTHVFRISKRLGLTSSKRPLHAYDEIQSIVPPRLRYSYHVGCISHGQSVCTSKRPKCSSCILSEICTKQNIE